MTPYSQITLLIVDDESEIRSGLRTIIPWQDYSISLVGCASSGAEALDMIRYYEPDIVITDIQMPGMNGLDLIDRARQEQFDCSFVILSGYDDFQYAKTAIRYGVEDYLLKPISIQELTALVEKLKEQILKKRNLHTDQLSTLKQLRHAQVSLRKNNLVPELLRNELSVPELAAALYEYSLPVKNTRSCAVLIQAFTARQDTEEEEELSRRLLPLFTDLEQHLTGFPALTAQLPPASFIIVFNLPDKSEDFTALKELLSEYANNTGSYGNFRLIAAAGSVVPSLTEISESYQIARQVMTYHIYPSLGNLIDASVLDGLEPPMIMPGEEFLDDILRADTESLKLHLDRYFQKLLDHPMPPPSYLYGLCNYLILHLRSELTRYLEEAPKSFAGDAYMVLQSLSTVDEIRSWMYDILSGFSDEMKVSRATKSDPLIEKAIDYIQKNILKNIHTEDVCNYLGLSKSYFSTYFKNKTQLNFRDYTLDLKISYAQEQLKLPEHTPSDVAIMLGYEDYRSFSRAFKTRTGLAPSDYQKKYLQAERS